MDKHDREAIDDLFRKVAEAERQGGERDAEAEAYIRSKLEGQPAAPYYLGQAVVMLEGALADANKRNASLEEELASRPAGGFLSTIFGGNAASGSSSGAARDASQRGTAPDETPRGTAPGEGRGFLGSAPGTGLAMVGGAMLGYGMASSFNTEAQAADQPADDGATGAEGADPGGDDLGGGDFDMDF